MFKFFIFISLGLMSSLANANVLVDVPGVGGVSFNENIQLTTPYDPTQSLWSQVDNAGVPDGSAVVVSQSVIAPTSGNATHIQWNGSGNAGLGFVIGVWDQSVTATTPPSMVGGFPGHVGGNSIASLSLPIGQITTSVAANGLTHYDAIIPPMAITAGHSYYISIAPVNGSWFWESAATCTTPTSCALLGKYSGATWVIMGALQILGSPPLAFQFTDDNSAAATPVPPVINTTILANATVGTAYSAPINFTVPAGDSATVSVSGLPAGLAYDTINNAITGAATVIGTFSVNVTIADATTSLSASSLLSLTVNDNVLTFAPVNFPDATTNSAYSAPFTVATGGYGAITYTATGLPSGLAIAGNTLSGTPTVAGLYAITLTATDSVGVISSANITLNVINPVAAPVACSGTNGVISAYTTGNPGSITINTGVNLLDHLWTTNLNATNTIFNGGLVNWYSTGAIVSWTGTADPTGCILNQLTVGPRVAITTSTLVNGVAGTAYTAPVTVTGGVGPYVTSVLGLPAGLSFNGVNIIGTPTAAGTFTVSVSSTDSLGVVAASAPLTLTVAAPVITSFSATLPSATVGTAYAGSVLAVGGYGALSYSATGLPAGLTLTGKNITGTPGTAGTFSVSFAVVDALGSHAATSGSITVANAAGGPSCTKPAGATGGLNSMGTITSIAGNVISFKTSKGVTVKVTVPTCAKIAWNGGAKAFALGQAFEWNGYSSAATGNVAQSVTIN
jgi:hypothetical protein